MKCIKTLHDDQYIRDQGVQQEQQRLESVQPNEESAGADPDAQQPKDKAPERRKRKIPSKVEENTAPSPKPSEPRRKLYGGGFIDTTI